MKITAIYRKVKPSDLVPGTKMEILTSYDWIEGIYPEIFEEDTYCNLFCKTLEDKIKNSSLRIIEKIEVKDDN